MANRIREQVNAARIPRFFSSITDHDPVASCRDLVPSRGECLRIWLTGRQVITRPSDTVAIRSEAGSSLRRAEGSNEKIVTELKEAR